MPIALSSFLSAGSMLCINESLLEAVVLIDGAGGGGDIGWTWLSRLGCFECPNKLPRKLVCCFSPPELTCPFAMPPPASDPNGLLLVFLWAFFSRSLTFFRNVLASFSSAKERPAMQFSSSKVWKKVRSWLYMKVS
jgi:hypothetical protein